MKVDHENRIYSWTEIPQQQLKNCFSNIFGSCSRVFLSATIFSFRTKIYFHWFWYMYMFFLDKRLSLLILKLYMYIDFICKCVFDSSKASNYSWLKFHFFLGHLSHSGDLLLWVGFRRHATCVNIFLSRTTGPILTKFGV